MLQRNDGSTRILIPGADTHSEDMQFAGLPKSCKIRRTAVQALGLGFTVIQFDTVDFNYGPFTFILSTAGAGAVVNEPGIYEAVGRCAVVSATNEYYLGIYVNGVQKGVTSHPNQTQNPYLQVSDQFELAANDIIQLQVYLSATISNTVGVVPTLYVEKKGGAY